MLVFSQKRQKTGGKGRIPVVKVTSTGADGFARLLEICQTELPAGKWWGFWPTAERPWDYTERRTPYVCVREDLLPVLVNEGVVELPEAYWQLCAHWCKRELWEDLWPHRLGEYGSGASRYWMLRERSLLIALRKSGEWVAAPEWVAPEVECDVEILIPGLKMIHGRIEIFDLGQQTPVNPGQNTDYLPNGSVNGSNGTDQSTPHPNLAEYSRLPEEQREAYLASKPWLRGLLNGSK